MIRCILCSFRISSPPFGFAKVWTTFDRMLAVNGVSWSGGRGVCDNCRTSLVKRITDPNYVISKDEEEILEHLIEGTNG